MSEQLTKGMPQKILALKSMDSSPPWITGFVATPLGDVNQATTTWDNLDRKGEIKARLSDRFQTNYP